jgi:hypothetical protein
MNKQVQDVQTQAAFQRGNLGPFGDDVLRSMSEAVCPLVAPALHKFLMMHLWRSVCSALRSYHFLLPFWLLNLLPVGAGQSLKRDQDGEKACMAVTGDLKSQLLRCRSEDRKKACMPRCWGRDADATTPLSVSSVSVSNASRVRVLSSPSKLAPLIVLGKVPASDFLHG